MMLDARNAMTREQASALANAMVQAVVANVHDRDTLNAIMADLRALVDTAGER